MINIKQFFNGLEITDNAKQAQHEIAAYLKSKGFNCILEYPVSDRGNGNPGRIDIVAIKGKDKLAIEVDRHSPRKKSIFKLNQLPDYQKVILLRGWGSGYEPGVNIMPIKIKGGD